MKLPTLIGLSPDQVMVSRSTPFQSATTIAFVECVCKIAFAFNFSNGNRRSPAQMLKIMRKSEIRLVFSAITKKNRIQNSYSVLKPI